jgi:hypothetical protein
MVMEEWSATYKAAGELSFAHELGSRTVAAPETFHSQMSHHPGEEHSLRITSAYFGEGPMMGFILDFRDAAAKKLAGVTVIHPRFGGVSTTYGLKLRRPLKWTEMDTGASVSSRMDDRFDLNVRRESASAWEMRAEAQNRDHPPYWLTSGVFRLELSSPDRPWREVVASFDTKATRQSGRGRIELTLQQRGLVYPGFDQS